MWNLRDWLKGRTSNISAEEIKELTDQFYVTLRAYMAGVQSSDKHPAFVRAEALLENGNPTWGDAYEIEQMLIYLFGDESLHTEIAVRTLEARNTLRPQLADLYEQQLSEAKTPQQQRTLLSRLVNDLQWRYTVDEVKRRYTTDITRRTGNLFAFSILLFVVWTAYLVFSKPAYGDLRLVILAALAGTWGACFSTLSSLKAKLQQSKLDDLKLMRPAVVLISRALIGTGAGTVLYFFARSGLLGGSAFPDLTDLNLASSPGKPLALLVVWCFIAGFSEKLVPSLLDKTEARAAADGDDRHRPESSPVSGTLVVRTPINVDASKVTDRSSPVTSNSEKGPSLEHA